MYTFNSSSGNNLGFLSKLQSKSRAIACYSSKRYEIPSQKKKTFFFLIFDKIEDDKYRSVIMQVCSTFLTRCGMKYTSNLCIKNKITIYERECRVSGHRVWFGFAARKITKPVVVTIFMLQSRYTHFTIQTFGCFAELYTFSLDQITFILLVIR